jgi:hypothetical protein
MVVGENCRTRYPPHPHGMIRIALDGTSSVSLFPHDGQEKSNDGN